VASFNLAHTVEPPLLIVDSVTMYSVNTLRAYKDTFVIFDTIIIIASFITITDKTTV